jgi:hypothetical protein
MCTLILQLSPGHRWPVLAAANRDERSARPAAAPARHWPQHPGTVAGLDLEAGGSWLGLNDHGLLAAVMNRTGTLGPAAGKRSRGELILLALKLSRAEAAARALADLDPGAYRPFNLVLADSARAYWLRHGGEGRIRVHPIPPGLHLLCATELDDPTHPRIALHGPRLLAAPVPRPERGDWDSWRGVLADPTYPPGLGPEAAMVQDRGDGFATRSSALIALPGRPGMAPVWLHADGRPDLVPYAPVDLAHAS